MKTLFTLFLWPTLVFGYPLTPDPVATPGSTCTANASDFEEYRYEEQIPYCHRNVSTKLKKEIYEFYNIEVSERKNYTIDHLIPLSIGGDNEEHNLWPEHKEVKALRPDLEWKLYVYLRDGKIRQKVAIERILKAKFNPEMVARRADNKLRSLEFFSLRQLDRALSQSLGAH